MPVTHEALVSPRTPTGFYVASVCAASFGALMAVMVLLMDQGDGLVWRAIPGRAAAALLAALSGVAAEALWRARPWAWRASLALAVAYAALVTLFSVVGNEGGLVAALWILISSGVVVVPLLMYIRSRSAALFGTPPVRYPVHRPLPYGPQPPPLHRPPPPPPPLPAGRRPPPWW